MDWQRRWWIALLSICLLILGFWVGPYALSVYQLEMGGRLLDEALNPVFPDRLAPEQIVNDARLAKATTHFQKALQRDPQNTMARRQLARVYLSQGDPEAALQLLQQAVDLRPNHLLLHLELGDVYDTLGRTEEAVAAYEAGKVGSRALPLAANYLKKADLMVERGSGDIAIGYWQRVLEFDPENLYALYRLWEIYQQLGAEQEAEHYEERLRYFDLQSNAIPMDLRLAEYQAQAMIGLVETGLWEREKLLNVISYQVWQFAEDLTGLMAHQVLETLLERWPEDADLLFYQAELHHRREELSEATIIYKSIVDVNPAYAEAYLRLGTVSERLEEAARWYLKYHTLAPDDVLGLKNLTEACSALEAAGEVTESCREAALCLSNSTVSASPQTSSSNETHELARASAAVLQEALAVQTDNRHIVGELLEVPVEDVQLGRNMVENGGFEEWTEEVPRGWMWSAMFSKMFFRSAAFSGGVEDLFVFRGQRAARIQGFWVGSQEEKGPARAGFWYTSTSAPISITNDLPYVIAFDYRTVGGVGQNATIWVSGEKNMLWLGDHRLPPTDGRWQHFVAVGWNMSETDAVIRPLIRLFASGSFMVDNLCISQIRLAHPEVMEKPHIRFLTGIK